MSDFLIEIGKNPQARNALKSLGLPIPIPQELRRARGPWEERPLQDLAVVVGAGPGAALGKVLPGIIVPAGASPWIAGDDAMAKPYQELGEAFARPPQVFAADPPDGLRPDALVFDATGLKTAASLGSLHDFFHPLTPRLNRCGRVIVIGRPPEGTKSPEAAAAQGALNGFVRSMSKEIGGKGSTAQLVYVAEGAEDRLAGVLRFLLSARSVYVTAQPLRVTATVKTKAAPAWVRPLEGKTALLTGAARGIGAATARLLADEGAHVVCLDRPQDDTTLAKVAAGVGGSPLLVDVRADDAPAKIAAALNALGGVDIVIHNAGVTQDRTMARMKRERWDMVLDINLAAVMAINKAIIAGPLKDDGRIVCLSSVAGIAGNMGQTNYAASKAAIITYVEKLAPILSDRGIAVNAIAPGFTETRMTDAMPVMVREVARRFNALSQAALPADIGQVITFMASPGAAGLTGTTLRVCGGTLIGA